MAAAGMMQRTQVLAGRAAIANPAPAPSILLRPQPPSVLARAEPRVTREYREGDDDVKEFPTTTGSSSASQPGNQPVYADEVARRVPKKKDNMSKEMKARLRKEYVGLGGAENSATMPASFRRGPLIVAALSVETRPQQEQEQQQEPNAPTMTSTSTTAPTQQPKKGRSKFVIDENENLKSTTEHRLWTYGCMALMAGTFAQGINHVQGPEDALGVAAALAAAYVLSDLGTGIYHWFVDNYGDGNTPVFGRQIAAFQGHHQRPWTITMREFANNVHQVFKPATFPAALFLALSFSAPAAQSVFLSSFLFLVCMSQQFHAWSHMKKSELPGIVLALQDSGVLISRKMHGAHHQAPFEGNYAIVSGIWNPLLDNSGFFRGLEKVVHATLGVEPRCWSMPDNDWAELEQPPAPSA